MGNLLQKHKIEIPYQDIAGLREARDNGWLKVLPAKPKNLLDLLRTFLGSQTDYNTDEDGKYAFPSYEYIMEVADFNKNQDITASIDFLALIGLINYKPATFYDDFSNRYYFQGYYTLTIFKNEQYIDGIISLIEKTRTPNSNSKSDPIRFKNALEEMKKLKDVILEDFFFVTPLFHSNEKIRKRNKKTAKAIEKFYAALYAALRNSVMDRQKYNFSKELSFYLNSTANSENTANSQDMANSEDMANRQFHGYASVYSPSNSPSNSPSDSLNNNNKPNEILDSLKQAFGYFVKEEYRQDLLLEKAKTYPVSQMEKALETLEIFINNKFPAKKIKLGFLEKVLEEPNPLRAESMVEQYIEQLNNVSKKDAGNATERDYYNQLFPAGSNNPHDKPEDIKDDDLPW